MKLTEQQFRVARVLAWNAGHPWSKLENIPENHSTEKLVAVAEEQFVDPGFTVDTYNFIGNKGPLTWQLLRNMDVLFRMHDNDGNEIYMLDWIDHEIKDMLIRRPLPLFDTQLDYIVEYLAEINDISATEQFRQSMEEKKELHQLMQFVEEWQDNYIEPIKQRLKKRLAKAYEYALPDGASSRARLRDENTTTWWFDLTVKHNGIEKNLKDSLSCAKIVKVLRERPNLTIEQAEKKISN